MLETQILSTNGMVQKYKISTDSCKLLHSRLFLVDALVENERQKRRDIVGNPTDPVWVGYCSYLSQLLEFAIRSGSVHEKLRPAVAEIANGGIVPGFNYCTSWSAAKGPNSLSNQRALSAVKRCIRDHGLPQPSNQAPQLDLIKERSLLNPAPVLTLRELWPRTGGRRLVALGDGRFLSPMPSRDPFFTDYNEYKRRRSTWKGIWLRWLDDSTLGLPPRDLSVGGTPLRAEYLLPRILLNGLLMSPENVLVVLLGCLNHVWPESALACLVEYFGKNPVKTSRIFGELRGGIPGEAWNLLVSGLPPDILALLI